MPTGIYETLLNNFKLLVEKFTYNKTDIDAKLNEKANNTVVSGSSNGLMSSADKTKLDTIEEGANKTTVDSSLSGESENPVQNKIIKTALDGKADISHNHTVTDITDLQTKLDEKLTITSLPTELNDILEQMLQE